MIALALQAVATFNLICSGGSIRGTDDPNAPAGMRDEFRSQFTDIYRIDLDQRRWCSNECRETRPIASVDSDTITLSNHDNRALGIYEIIRINRESGRYELLSGVGGNREGRFGTCERTLFTGFPTRRF